MGIVVPEGYSDVTLIVTAAGITREFTTSIGIAPITLDPPTPAEIADNFYDISTAADRPWHPSLMSNQYTFQGVSVRTTVDGLPLIGTHLDPVQGTNSLGPSPCNCALLVKKNTAAGGRKNRGRMYVTPHIIAETHVNAVGVIDDDVVATVQTWFDSWVDDIVGLDYEGVLFHSDSTTPTQLSSLSVESLIATQRRRMR